MIIENIKEVYEDIFASYDKPSLEEHIKKFIELDVYLPYNATFFCITNTQDLSFEFVSKNIEACIGINKHVLEEKGMRHLWSFMHPDDIDKWLQALDGLMKFTLAEIPEEDRSLMSYTWNYRLKNHEGKYVNVIQNTTPLKFDETNKPIIGLAHYTVLDSEISLEVCASAKRLNANNEYETVYFNTYSRKLLSEGISNRERDIIRLLVLNKTSKEIANSLSISPNTVDTHRRNILKKLKISSTGELIGMLKMNQNLI
ncbi:LuxR C-terminal-related transcriptional regulator [Winogradskyella aurantiaca]|uniref:LuxR C-terminal-related transcriptional regulator n=1 Tax=Winogradskyella aurantiaca TaxID=2219558 RepID=UPI000E1C81B4|nr:LuxR C-terminal-related transcriptional regulator [Winogradskyella aurantiaca]